MPRGLCALLAALLVAALGGCHQSTPPRADIAGGRVGQAAFTFLRWKRGLAIMVWHDLDASLERGSGSAGDAVYRLEGRASSLDGRRVDWLVLTTDGRTAQFWIDGTSYDLEAGSLFVVTTQGGTTNIRQLHRDLLGVQPDYDSCVAFAQGDPELARMLD